MNQTLLVKMRDNLKVISMILFVLILSSCQEEVMTVSEFKDQASAVGDAVSISNSGFESDWSNWNDTDPSSISGNANSGSKSAKISGSGGRFDRSLSVKSNTNYTLSAYVKGGWRIGAEYGGNRETRSGNASDWKKESVTFNTGSSSSITILGEYNSSEGRFDDFELIEGQGSTAGGSTERHLEMVGEIVRIENVSSDLWVRIDATSTGAPVELTTQSSTGDWPKWEVEEVSDGGNYYYRFRNIASNKRFRTTGTGTRDIEMGSTTNTGAWTQWEVSSDGSGNYTFKNRTHGTYLHANDNDNTNHVQTTNSLSGNSTTWRIEDLNGDDVNGDNTPGGGTLDPNKSPGENFDLSKWKITLSSAAEKTPEDLIGGYELSNQFYTDPSDGGMVFKNYPKGAGTTTTSTYSRVEFREMLRGTEDWWDATYPNDDYPNTSDLMNNWVFSSSSATTEANAGGVDGTMKATLKVNSVTTTSSSSSQNGRIIIGQIHAEGNEPIRLYYHKQPSHQNGAIYYAHEPNSGNERFYNILGSNYVDECDGCSGAGDYEGGGNPSDGIALNEEFSYEIKVVGNLLEVFIYDDNGTQIGYDDRNMSSSGFANEYMYFKAGVYSGDKSTQSSTDYQQVTFYALDVTHN